jgi:2-oxo-4-hydroxy-4-carboxy-5-ureidoimidazoline decarboxylase
MSRALARWNGLSTDQAASEILPCCGSSAWAKGMACRRPIMDAASLLDAADEIWRGLAESDWMEAYRSHPRIGESKAGAPAPPRAASWSADEQRSVTSADDAVKMALAEANRKYEARFGRIFIVCASGKSPAEILQILTRRLQNSEEAEMREAAEQQRQITRIRLKKWLEG